MDAKPTGMEVDEPSDEVEDDLSAAEADLERLPVLDPADTPDLARRINERLARVLDATDGQLT